MIVESPAKATKIASFLGSSYVVESSRGHVADLPTGASEVPAKYKGEKWARTGVDVDNNFEPLYVVQADKKGTIRDLKAKLATADELLLATDEDREGEAIAWHLLEVLNPKVPVRRMVFHEITPEAIRHAIDHPRELDRRLVDAQETRRILDRLVGYEVSPVLWKKVNRGLSAGRVQSVATRVVVERERERMAFHAGAWWDLQGRSPSEGGFGRWYLEEPGGRCDERCGAAGVSREVRASHVAEVADRFQRSISMTVQVSCSARMKYAPIAETAGTSASIMEA